MISLDLTKSSEVRKAGDQPKFHGRSVIIFSWIQFVYLATLVKTTGYFAGHSFLSVPQETMPTKVALPLTYLSILA